MKNYLSYKDVRKFVHFLKLKNSREWMDYIKGRFSNLPSLPDNIPANPYDVYLNNGWKNWKNWLGKTYSSDYATYEKASEFVHRLNLKGEHEWRKYINSEQAGLPSKPDFIPDEPYIVYKGEGWKGWDAWLKKTKETKFEEPRMMTLWESAEIQKWLPYNDARNFARSLGLEYKEQWNIYVKGLYSDKKALPENIPKDPDWIYRYTGWRDWSDWLIDPHEKKKYLSFFEARKFARSLRLKDRLQWFSYVEEYSQKVKTFRNIPDKPNLEYEKRGWSGWDDWLGVNIKYADFKSAKKFVRSLNLNSHENWKAYCKGHIPELGQKPINIFAYPELAYKDEGWVSWKDWLVDPDDNKTKDINKKSQIVECSCKGLNPTCSKCEGKGYYYPFRSDEVNV